MRRLAFKLSIVLIGLALVAFALWAKKMEDRKWATSYRIIQRHEGIEKEWIGDHLDTIYRDSTSFSFRDTKTGRKVTVIGGAIEITKTETNLE